MKKEKDIITKMEKDELKQLVKSVYKSVLKSLRAKAKAKASDVVNDVLDANYVAEVDPDEIPAKKDKILYKKDSNQCKSHEKGVNKLKKMCVKLKEKKA